jgi:hypothetical protein
VKILLQVDLDRFISERELFEAKNLARVVSYMAKKALTSSYNKRLAYLEGKRIVTLNEYTKNNKLSHSNLINKANRQTIETFLET